MSMLKAGLRWTAAILLWLVVALCLAVTIVPRFLDRLYYRGPVSGHYDGQRFFNPDGDAETFIPAKGSSRAGFFWRYLTGSDDRPDWPDRVAVARDHPPARVEGKAMRVTWIGHASVLVQTNGLNILTDPIWSRTAGPLGIGPARVAEPGVAFDDLPRIDLVLISHDHYDHMDLETLGRLWRRDRPMIVTSLGNDAILRARGMQAVGRDWGGRVVVKPGVDVIVTRNHHWGSRWFTDRNRALWSSFVVQLPGGNLFFGGDTGAGDLKWADKAAGYGPVRLAILPIGAFRFQPGQMESGSHIGPVDAVEVYRRLGAAHGLGVHWGTFHLSSEARDTPPRLLVAARECAGLGDRFGTLPIGRAASIPADRAPPMPVVSRDALLACLDTPAVHALR